MSTWVLRIPFDGSISKWYLLHGLMSSWNAKWLWLFPLTKDPLFHVCQFFLNMKGKLMMNKMPVKSWTLIKPRDNLLTREGRRSWCGLLVCLARLTAVQRVLGKISMYIMHTECRSMAHEAPSCIHQTVARGQGWSYLSGSEGVKVGCLVALLLLLVCCGRRLERLGTINTMLISVGWD